MRIFPAKSKTKMALLGPQSCGKTAICEGMTGKEFSNISQSTAASNYFTTNFFTIWDTAGSEKYRSMLSMYFKEAITLFVIDGGKTAAANKEEIIAFLNGLADCKENIVALYVIVAKADILEDEESAYETLANEIFTDFTYLGVCSAKNATNIQAAFALIKANDKTDFMAHVKINLKFSPNRLHASESGSTEPQTVFLDEEVPQIKKKSGPKKKVSFCETVSIYSQKRETKGWLNDSASQPSSSDYSLIKL